MSAVFHIHITIYHISAVISYIYISITIILTITMIYMGFYICVYMSDEYLPCGVARTRGVQKPPNPQQAAALAS